MQIGFEAKRLFLNDRGLGNYARNLLYGFLKYQPEHFYHLYTPKVSNAYVSPALLTSENIAVHQPKSTLHNLSKSYWRSMSLGKVSNQDNIDVFHGLSQELPKDIRRSKAKSVVTIHDMIFLRHPEFYKPIDRWIYFNKVKFAVQNADRIIAISKQTKNDLIDTFSLDENNIDVIYQSCNEVFYEKRAVTELENVKTKWSLPQEYLLYVGALNGNKNVLAILKAMALLKGKMDLPLVIVGHGKEYKNELKEFATKNQLISKLIFASEIANPTPLELSSFYQMASVFIFPSFYEGFGIPILEARFSGTPVIASNSTCLDEVGGNESLYFSPENAEELASHIENTLRKEMQGKPKDLIKFHQQTHIEQLVTLYQNA